MRVGACLQEVDGVGHDSQPGEALAQLRVLGEEIPELVQCGLDLAVGALEQRVDESPDVVTDAHRSLGDREPRLGALLEPLGGLAVRLIATPGMEEGRHEIPIGRRKSRASTLFA